MTDRDSYFPRDEDEALSGLLDGVLPEEEAGRLRERLAGDPVLAARLAALEQAGVKVRDGYVSVVDEPLPDSVLDLLKDGEGGDNVVPLSGKPRPRIAWVPSAVAAGIALAIGLAIGVSLDTATDAREDLYFAGGVIGSSAALYEVLESAPSGETREIGTELAATPRFTFRAVDGGYCRQVGVTAGRRQAETLACRRDGAWEVEAAVFVARTAAPGGVYRPAGRETAPIDTAVEALIDGAPLATELESRVIASGWTGALE